MSSFTIYTLGCKVNNYESESYREGLIKAGFKECVPGDRADIYIINTCALTATAAAKCRKMISRAKRLNPDAFICVVSCLAECYPAEIEKLGGVDLMIGTAGKSELVPLITKHHQAKQIAPLRPEAVIRDFEELPLSDHQRVRASLKIQEGCDQHCSYCIIPAARGPERSLEPAKVLAAARVLARRHREIVLAGIHTGRYGRDLGTDLLSLLKELIEIPKLERLRLSSIEITEISDELLGFAAENRKLARHFHIPLQSGSDPILRAMRRPYSAEEYYQRLCEIRKRLPDFIVSSDIMVGFPGESEERWQESQDFIERCDFGFLHVFPYSSRINTEAVDLSDQVEELTKKQRVTELLCYSNRQKSRLQESFIGKDLEVLVEKTENDRSYGHSSEYLPVEILAEPASNTIVKVTATGTGRKGIVAEICQKNLRKSPE